MPDMVTERWSNMKKMLQHLLLLASSVVFGPPAVTAADHVRDTTGHRVNDYFDWNYSSLESANTRSGYPHAMIATSQPNPIGNTLVVMSACETRTLAWNPGLNRYYCAEWWIEASTIRDDPGSVTIQMEYSRTMTRMQGRGTREGFPLCQVNIRVTGSDTHRSDAISGYSRSVGTVLTSYRYSTGSERTDCQELQLRHYAHHFPAASVPPAGPDNEGLVENESYLISRITEELVFRRS